MPFLYIAEKPKMGKAIADALPKPLVNKSNRGTGYIQAANGDIVTWFFGHILEPASPDEYDEEYKSWSLSHLPIVPDNWKMKESADKRPQIRVVDKLIKKGLTIVNAGDPDREGQLLIDEYLYDRGCEKDAKRILIHDLNPGPIKKAIQSLRDNSEYESLYKAGLARQRADWLYGLNMTRAYTLLGQAGGYKGMLTVGRVQTPLLGIIVRRDLEIENFVPRSYFEVFSNIKTDSIPFTAKWAPSDTHAASMDEENRVLDKKVADNVASKCANKPAKITSAEKTKKKKTAPLPFNLAKLTMEANKKINLGAKEVLDATQYLYEQGLVTYPRSECEYLPNDHFNEAPGILSNIGKSHPSLKQFTDNADFQLKSRCWNTKKVNDSSHHAIIPTNKHANFNSLSKGQQGIYDLICRRYIIQFFPAYEYMATKVEAVIEQELFIAKGNQPIKAGWTAVYKEDMEDGTNEKSPTLPELKAGDVHQGCDTYIKDKETKPPKYFTEGDLIGLMANIAKYVDNPTVKAKLKETSGIGTSATRSTIIESLFKRQLIVKKGKSVRSTPAGKSLIKALPLLATTPDMTALWESNMDEIVSKDLTETRFISTLTEQVQRLIDSAKKQGAINIKGMPSAGKNPPSKKMLAVARSIAKKKNIRPPTGTYTDAKLCYEFLKEHVKQRDPNDTKPSQGQIDFANKISKQLEIALPENVQTDRKACSDYIESGLKKLKQKQKAEDMKIPPTPGQIAFAKNLISKLPPGKKPPKDVLTVKSVCMKFLSSNSKKTKRKKK